VAASTDEGSWGVRALPGADLVEAGLADLTAGVESVPALLVAAFSMRLRRLGYAVPDRLPDEPLLQLYRLLERNRADAHTHFNALLRRMVSFAEAAECVR
jgi:hypothetical protein